MNLVGPFFRLIRWPNLLFIAVTQCLFHFCVVRPTAYGHFFLHLPVLQLKTHLFVLLCFSSILIAAAGYIINDYFDINIDLVNKPQKMVIEKIINRRWALVWHLVLSGVGVLIGLYVSWKLQNWLIGLANIACVLLLWYYSTSYKRQLLIGNIIISALTAWVVLVMLVAELPGWWGGKFETIGEKLAAAKLLSIGLLYAGFAFALSIIREVIKDMEDMEGDRRDGCRTMPIEWGTNASKVFTAVWLIVIIATLIITGVYIFIAKWWLMGIYNLLLVTVPTIYIFRLLFQARETADFSKLSRLVKIVMLTGILSMVFFLWYTK